MEEEHSLHPNSLQDCPPFQWSQQTPEKEATVPCKCTVWETISVAHESLRNTPVGHSEILERGQ